MLQADYIFANEFLNQSIENFSNEFGNGKTIQETEKILYSKLSIFAKSFVNNKVKQDLLEEGWYPVGDVSLPTIQNFFRSGDMSSRSWSKNNNKLDSTEALHSLYELIIEDYNLEKKLPFDTFRKMTIKQMFDFIKKNFNLFNQ